MQTIRVFCLVAIIAIRPASAALTIDVDLTLDTAGFFSNSSQSACLTQATSFFDGLILDTLDPISPTNTWSSGVGNRWQPTFTHPSTLANHTLDTLTVLTGEIKLFVGAAGLGGSLGQAGPGGYQVSGDQTFVGSVTTRGEVGTEFAPWGGSLTVNNGVSWDFGVVGNCAALDGSGNNHFYSVLLHELGHVLGLGTSDSWDAKVNGSNQFTGTASVAEHGGNVPLHTDSSHWVNGTTSNILGTSTSQEAAMDPTLLAGTAKLFTNLDVAALSDVGWNVTAVPEPSSVAFGSLMLVFAALYTFSKRLALRFRQK